MRKNTLIGALGIWFGITGSVLAWRSQLYPENWTPEYKDSQGRFLHDFSYAGYHAGEQDVPDDPPGALRDVTQPPYNADNTGTQDVTVKIQQAIYDAGDAGGGIVFLPAGTYRVQPGSKNFSLHINKSGVVLRGAGTDKTFIFNDEPVMRGKSVIWISPSTSSVSWTGSASNTAPVTTDALFSTKSLPVSSTTGFSIGDWIVVRTDATAAWIAEHEMTGIWSSSYGGITLYRRITGISGNTITVDAPTRYWMKTRDNFRIYKVAVHLSEVGLEDFSIGNRENPKFDTMGLTDYTVSGTGGYEVHGAYMITYNHTVNGWARRVNTYCPTVNTKGYNIVSNGIRLNYCRQVTLTECVWKLAQYQGGGGNGYHFRLECNDCLLSFCTAQSGRHNYSHCSMMTSGNVTYRCKSLLGGIPTDFHMRMSAANLFDNMEMMRDFIEAKLRGESHGHATSQSVIWNTNGLFYSTYRPYDVDYIVDSGQFGNGYVIGTRGRAYRVYIHTEDDKGIKPDDWLEGEGEGEALEPQSLYEDQLFKRTGKTAIGQQSPDGYRRLSTRGPAVAVYPDPVRDRAEFVLAGNLGIRHSAPPVRLVITDSDGTVVTVLESDGSRPFVWGGRDLSGSPVPPGIYFYTVAVGNGRYSGRIIKIR